MIQEGSLVRVRQDTNLIVSPMERYAGKVYTVTQCLYVHDIRAYILSGSNLFWAEELLEEVDHKEVDHKIYPSKKCLMDFL